MHYNRLDHSVFHIVIFDMDGTLTDSAVLTMAACSKFAPGLGLPVPSREAVKRATGYPNPEFYYILYPDFSREAVGTLGKLVEQEEHCILRAVRDTLLFKGCRELLADLRKQQVRLCIASTGDNGHVHSILRETGIIDLFDTISCGLPDKTETLRELVRNRDKNGFVMVGDMKKDYEAARANGILSVGACYGYCEKELSDFDLYIDTPQELLRILKFKGE